MGIWMDAFVVLCIALLGIDFGLLVRIRRDKKRDKKQYYGDGGEK